VQNERILELQADKARAEQALQRLEHARQQDQTTHASRIDALRCEWSGRLQDVVDKKEALEEQVRRARIECKEIMVKHEHEVRSLCFSHLCPLFTCDTCNPGALLRTYGHTTSPCLHRNKARARMGVEESWLISVLPCDKGVVGLLF
jgi:hypothetical protein